MSKFKVGDEVIAYGKSYGIIKDLGDIGCLITFKDETHHVQYPDIKTSPHQELLDLGFIISDETIYHVSYMFNGLDLTIFKKEKTYQTYVHNDNYNPINLQLAKILVRYLEEL